MTAFRTRTSLAVASIAIACALAGCSTAPSPAPTAAGGSAPPAASPSASSSTGSGAGLNACAIVTEDLIKNNLGVDPGAPQPKNTDTCDYQVTGSVLIVAQTSDQASLYFPASIYSTAAVQGTVNIPSGVDRGYYGGPSAGSQNGSFLVVKGEKAVWVTIFIQSAYTAAQVLALANAVAAEI